MNNVNRSKPCIDVDHTVAATVEDRTRLDHVMGDTMAAGVELTVRAVVTVVRVVVCTIAVVAISACQASGGDSPRCLITTDEVETLSESQIKNLFELYMELRDETLPVRN